MDRHEKIIQLVRMKGPLLPSQINKEVKTDVLFASAMLSELVDRKVLKLSKAKIGGSPVYFMSGQEARLSILYKYLHEKEKRAYDRLKSSKILRDSEQEPVVRAALREIKDFAVPLEVTLEGNVEVFWKWHTIKDEEAESLIKKQLNINSPASQPEPTPQPLPQQAVPQPVPISPPQPIQQQAPQLQQVSPTERIEQQAPAEQEVIKPELSEEMNKVEEEIKQELDKEYGQKKKIKKKETQKMLSEEPLPEPKLEFPENDALFDKVSVYFKDNEITIKNINVIRKNSEIDFVIDLPSNIGLLEYFCKAKSKQKLNDGDLSTAFIQGQMKKMPILFITLGDMTKKAQELLNTEFKTMFVRKIE